MPITGNTAFHESYCDLEIFKHYLKLQPQPKMYYLNIQLI